MGDRYTLDLDCAYCREKNVDVWFAPTSNVYTFKCAKCGKVNFISMKVATAFKSMKLEDFTENDIAEAFIETTNSSWDEAEITEMCRATYDELKAIKQ